MEGKKTLFCLIALFLLFGCPQQESQTIKLGFIAPLTGDAASYGQSEKNVVLMAVEEINESGGINGKKLEVTYEDGKCSGKDAATAAQKLINVDKVKVILGGACSGETLAMAPIAEKARVVILSSFSSSPDLTNAGDYIFRNSPSDEDGGRVSARLVAEKAKTVAMLSEDTPYAHGLRKVFKEEFTRLGGKILSDETYPQGASDYRIQLTKMKASNSEAFFFNPQTGKTGGNSVKQAKELGIEEPFFGTFAFAEEDAKKMAGNALEGMTFSNAPGLSKNPESKEFLQKYNEKFNSMPSSEYEAGARYDSVYIIAEAIREVGYDAEKIKSWLYEMSEFKGLIGEYRFDENGDLLGVSFIGQKIVNGEAVDYEAS